MEDELLAEEMQAQVAAAKQIVFQLEAEIRDTMDSLELQTAAAEARRLRADRGTAKLQREQEQMVTAGRRHAALIVKWWLWGSLLGWLLAIIVSVLVSPVLGFIVVVPVIALFLLVGYASSSVEMRVDLAQAKRASQRGHGHQRGASSVSGPEEETEEFISSILGDAYYDGAGGAYRRGGYTDGGGGQGGVVGWIGGVLYGAGTGVVGGARWLLGYGGGGGGGSGGSRHGKRD